jgi:hypothetical protein
MHQDDAFETDSIDLCPSQAASIDLLLPYTGSASIDLLLPYTGSGSDASIDLPLRSIPDRKHSGQKSVRFVDEDGYEVKGRKGITCSDLDWYELELLGLEHRMRVADDRRAKLNKARDIVGASPDSLGSIGLAEDKTMNAPSDDGCVRDSTVFSPILDAKVDTGCLLDDFVQTELCILKDDVGDLARNHKNSRSEVIDDLAQPKTSSSIGRSQDVIQCLRRNIKAQLELQFQTLLSKETAMDPTTRLYLERTLAEISGKIDELNVDYAQADTEQAHAGVPQQGLAMDLSLNVPESEAVSMTAKVGEGGTESLPGSPRRNAVFVARKGSDNGFENSMNECKASGIEELDTTKTVNIETQATTRRNAVYSPRREPLDLLSRPKSVTEIAQKELVTETEPSSGCQQMEDISKCSEEESKTNTILVVDETRAVPAKSGKHETIAEVFDEKTKNHAEEVSPRPQPSDDTDMKSTERVSGVDRVHEEASEALEHIQEPTARANEQVHAVADSSPGKDSSRPDEPGPAASIHSISEGVDKDVDKEVPLNVEAGVEEIHGVVESQAVINSEKVEGQAVIDSEDVEGQAVLDIEKVEGQAIINSEKERCKDEKGLMERESESCPDGSPGPTARGSLASPRGSPRGTGAAAFKITSSSELTGSIGSMMSKQGKTGAPSRNLGAGTSAPMASPRRRKRYQDTVNGSVGKGGATIVTQEINQNVADASPSKVDSRREVTQMLEEESVGVKIDDLNLAKMLEKCDIDEFHTEEEHSDLVAEYSKKLLADSQRNPTTVAVPVVSFYTDEEKSAKKDAPLSPKRPADLPTAPISVSPKTSKTLSPKLKMRPIPALAMNEAVSVDCSTPKGGIGKSNFTSKAGAGDPVASPGESSTAHSGTSSQMPTARIHPLNPVIPSQLSSNISPPQAETLYTERALICDKKVSGLDLSADTAEVTGEGSQDANNDDIRQSLNSPRGTSPQAASPLRMAKFGRGAIKSLVSSPRLDKQNAVQPEPQPQRQTHRLRERVKEVETEVLQGVEDEPAQSMKIHSMKETPTPLGHEHEAAGPGEYGSDDYVDLDASPERPSLVMIIEEKDGVVNVRTVPSGSQSSSPRPAGAGKHIEIPIMLPSHVDEEAQGDDQEFHDTPRGTARRQERTSFTIADGGIGLGGESNIASLGERKVSPLKASGNKNEGSNVGNFYSTQTYQGAYSRYHYQQKGNVLSPWLLRTSRMWEIPKALGHSALARRPNTAPNSETDIGNADGSVDTVVRIAGGGGVQTEVKVEPLPTGTESSAASVPLPALSHCLPMMPPATQSTPTNVLTKLITKGDILDEKVLPKILRSPSLLIADKVMSPQHLHAGASASPLWETEALFREFIDQKHSPHSACLVHPHTTRDNAVRQHIVGTLKDHYFHEEAHSPEGVIPVDDLVQECLEADLEASSMAKTASLEDRKEESTTGIFYNKPSLYVSGADNNFVQAQFRRFKEKQFETYLANQERLQHMKREQEEQRKRVEEVMRRGRYTELAYMNLQSAVKGSTLAERQKAAAYRELAKPKRPVSGQASKIRSGSWTNRRRVIGSNVSLDLSLSYSPGKYEAVVSSMVRGPTETIAEFERMLGSGRDRARRHEFTESENAGTRFQTLCAYLDEQLTVSDRLQTELTDNSNARDSLDLSEMPTSMDPTVGAESGEAGYIDQGDRHEVEEHMSKRGKGQASDVSVAPTELPAKGSDGNIRSVTQDSALGDCVDMSGHADVTANKSGDQENGIAMMIVESVIPRRHEHHSIDSIEIVAEEFQGLQESGGVSFEAANHADEGAANKDGLSSGVAMGTPIGDLEGRGKDRRVGLEDDRWSLLVDDITSSGSELVNRMYATMKAVGPKSKGTARKESNDADFKAHIDHILASASSGNLETNAQPVAEQLDEKGGESTGKKPGKYIPHAQISVQTNSPHIERQATNAARRQLAASTGKNVSPRKIGPRNPYVDVTKVAIASAEKALKHSKARLERQRTRNVTKVAMINAPIDLPSKTRKSGAPRPEKRNQFDGISPKVR